MEGSQYRGQDTDGQDFAPEELNHRIQISGLLIWLILFLLCAILGGLIAWACTETITIYEMDGTQRVVHPIEYVIN